MARVPIFIGWGGDGPSKTIAQLVVEWVPRVLPTLKPLIATDIRKGAGWMDELGAMLEAARGGLFIFTRENVSNVWMHFEAGAIWRGSRAPTCALAFGVSEKELHGPFEQFQITNGLDRGSMWQLIESLRELSGIDKPEVDYPFDSAWKEFYGKVTQALPTLGIAGPLITLSDAESRGLMYLTGVSAEKRMRPKDNLRE
jgi:hypothetical protein